MSRPARIQLGKLANLVETRCISEIKEMTEEGRP